MNAAPQADFRRLRRHVRRSMLYSFQPVQALILAGAVSSLLPESIGPHTLL